MFSKNYAALYSIVTVVLCGLLLVLLKVFAPYPFVSMQSIVLPLKVGVLKGTLWLPSDRAEPSKRAAVLLVHGVASSRRTMQNMARNLAKHGIAAFAIDLRGYGESVDTASGTIDHGIDLEAALRFLRAHPAIDKNNVSALGHSLGATQVALLKTNARNTTGLKHRIAMGMRPYAKHENNNLQWWTGRYDALHPPYLYPPSLPHWVSPCADHQLEPEDFCSQNHLLRMLGAEPTSLRHYTEHALWVFLGTALCIAMASVPLAVVGYPLFLSALIGMLPFLWGGYFQSLYGPYCASVIVLMVLAYGIRLLSFQWKRRLCFVLFCLLGARFVAALLRGLYGYIADPFSLTEARFLPVYLVQYVLHAPQWLHDKMVGLLFVQQYERLEPSLIFWGLLMLEGIWPGGGLLQRLTFHKMSASKQKNPQLLYGLLVGSLVIGGVVLFQRYQQGYLHRAALLNVVPLFFGEILPTTLVFFLFYFGGFKKGFNKHIK